MENRTIDVGGYATLLKKGDKFSPINMDQDYFWIRPNGHETKMEILDALYQVEDWSGLNKDQKGEIVMILASLAESVLTGAHVLNHPEHNHPPHADGFTIEYLREQKDKIWIILER